MNICIGGEIMPISELHQLRLRSTDSTEFLGRVRERVREQLDQKEVEALVKWFWHCKQLAQHRR
jgi:hypothetical protein